jgi:hypothetical protein
MQFGERLKGDVPGERREPEKQVDEKADGAGEQVPGEEPEGVFVSADLELGGEHSRKEHAADDPVERRCQGRNVEPERGPRGSDPEPVADVGGDVPHQDGDGPFRPDACPGEERENRREECAGKRPIVGLLLSALERVGDPAVDNGRCVQVFAAEADEQREGEDACRDRPGVGLHEAVLDPDDPVEQPVEGEVGDRKEDGDYGDEDDLPEVRGSFPATGLNADPLFRRRRTVCRCWHGRHDAARSWVLSNLPCGRAPCTGQKKEYPFPKGNGVTFVGAASRRAPS